MPPKKKGKPKEHPFQLRHVIFEEMKAKTFYPEDIDCEIPININFDLGNSEYFPLDDNRFTVTINAEAVGICKSKNGEEIEAFKIYVAAVGMFSKPATIDDSIIANFAKWGAVFVLLPYIRVQINQLATSLGYNFHVPLLTVPLKKLVSSTTKAKKTKSGKTKKSAGSKK